MWLDSPFKTLTVGVMTMVIGALIISGGLSVLSTFFPM